MVSRVPIMKSSKLWCQLDGVFCGVVYAGIIGLLGLRESLLLRDSVPIPDDLLLRMFFGFALMVCAKPVFDGAVIELASENPPRLGRVYLGMAGGSNWAILLFLAAWPSSQADLSILIVIYLIAGIFFGAVIAKMHRIVPISKDRLALYDLSKNVYAGYHPFLRIAPNLYVLIILFIWFVLRYWVKVPLQPQPYILMALVVVLGNGGTPYLFVSRWRSAFQFIVGSAAILAGYLAT